MNAYSSYILLFLVGITNHTEEEKLLVKFLQITESFSSLASKHCLHLTTDGDNE